ncbi:MAG TPA: dienelactone hydrolase family protein [Chloroflexota bacterium]|jgi:carboxymethylenebutenolidase|nr:dienelactone hydrolase family protein [Chloroflexota bacterium]
MGTSVEFPSNGGTDQGWLAASRTGNGPGVIVIQEWWGLVQHIKDVCERFARAGFTALAPDLYHGRTVGEPDAATKAMMALNMQQVVRDMSGAVDYLRGLASVSGNGLGVVGFCMGGGLSLLLAQQRPDAIRAVAPFYGVGPALGDIQSWSVANAAFQGHYAERDDSAGPKAARQLEAELRAAGKEAEFFVYPGTHHAFFNDTRPEVYDAEAAQLAWDRTVSFLRAKLT